MPGLACCCWIFNCDISKSLDSAEDFKPHQLFCRNIKICHNLHTFWKSLGFGCLWSKFVFLKFDFWFGSCCPFQSLSVLGIFSWFCRYQQERLSETLGICGLSEHRGLEIVQKQKRCEIMCIRKLVWSVIFSFSWTHLPWDSNGLGTWFLFSKNLFTLDHQ